MKSVENEDEITSDKFKSSMSEWFGIKKPNEWKKIAKKLKPWSINKKIL